MTTSRRNFGTDDYSVLDVSGKAYEQEFFSFPGTFLQYLTDSTKSITIALGSGGAGPPKEIQLTPGGKIELQDKSRPFSGFFLSCKALDSARILVANSGIEVTPSPSRITQIGEVERIVDPIQLTKPVGNAGLVLPIDIASLTDSQGDAVAGRYVDIDFSSTPGQLGNWSNVPAHNAQLNQLSANPPMTYLLPIGRSAQTLKALYPVAKGDVIYILSADVLIGLAEGGPTNANGTMDSFNPPDGVSVGFNEDLGDFSAIQNRLTSTSDAHVIYLLHSSSRQNALNRDASNSALYQASIEQQAMIMATDTLNLLVRIPLMSPAGYGRFARTAGNVSGKCILKPAIRGHVKAVLLKKGVDF